MLTVTVLGAGLLAMPSALSKMGIFLGIFVIIWAGFTSAFGLYLQTRCARYVDRGHASFATLSQLTYPNLSILFDTAIAVKCFGVAVSYLIIIGDLMPGVVIGFAPGTRDVNFLVDRQFWITAFM
jgi:amino acid permease